VAKCTVPSLLGATKETVTDTSDMTRQQPAQGGECGGPASYGAAGEQVEQPKRDEVNDPEITEDR